HDPRSLSGQDRRLLHRRRVRYCAHDRGVAQTDALSRTRPLLHRGGLSKPGYDDAAFVARSYDLCRAVFERADVRLRVVRRHGPGVAGTAIVLSASLL